MYISRSCWVVFLSIKMLSKFSFYFKNWIWSVSAQCFRSINSRERALNEGRLTKWSLTTDKAEVSGILESITIDQVTVSRIWDFRQSKEDWVNQIKILHCYRQILLSSDSDIIIKMCSVLLSEAPSVEGTIFIFGLCSPSILMEITDLCSGASTWSLCFSPPSPKKRSVEKAYQVCRAQQWFRTGTKNMISEGSLGITTRGCEGSNWLWPMRPACRWERHGNLSGNSLWYQLPSPLSSITLAFT